MKIAIAQTNPVKGNIDMNIRDHVSLVRLAIAEGAGTIIFPELSLTGYEPSLAAKLATSQDDERLFVFQELSTTHQLIICVGLPIAMKKGTSIGMVIFQPGAERQTYLKKYLHADEEPFFISGELFTGPIGNPPGMALAICYEISIPAHAANASACGASVFLASVAKSVTGMDKSIETLSGIASHYSMTVLMSNCTGHCDDFECGGKSSIWNDKGILVGQLGASDEGILLIDTVTGQVISQVL
ncbi:MAG TPA: carbon-nitrogen hydrolase family protein [Chitinophagaceae bacterium]|nr:carbon-nitrogen hydrolase family protein [Chitinophagaceae bacterium]